MKKANQRPTRGLWDWIMTGEWDGGRGNTGGDNG
jgi:hypothetical protein